MPSQFPSNDPAGSGRGSSPARDNLPKATSRIVGRDDAIAAIWQDVGSARLLSIVGAGGIGKTTVALAVAEQAIGAFRDGVWLVDFAPLHDPLLASNAIANATGLVVHSADTMAALCRFLRDRETLLVFDNCEHMVGAIALCIGQILAAAPGVHIMTTSRSPLRVEGEQVVRLPGLATPPAAGVVSATSAMAFPAIQLFVDRAKDRLETFALSDADAPVVADICRSLDGIALAIELAAMRIDVFGVVDLRQQIADRFRVLAGRRGGLERHRTLAATLDWSYSLLPAAQATSLRAISVFAGGFRLEDASAVAAGEAREILAELVAQSLLSTDRDVHNGEVTYRLLESTRAYCQALLVESGEDRVIRLRYARHIRKVIEQAAGEWAHRPAGEWGASYGRYLDDVRTVLAWCDSEPDHADLLIGLTSAGMTLWNHFSLTNESGMHLRRAISAQLAAGLAGSAVEMRLQLGLAGAVIYTRGMVQEAWTAMQRGLEIALQLDDSGARLSCLRMIGTYQLFSGHSKAGIGTLESFITLARAFDPAAIPEGETHLGVGETFVGQLLDARRRAERLYAQGMQDLDDANSLRFLYNNSINVMIVLSHAQWLTGSPDAAAATAARVVDYGLRAGHELSMSIGLAWDCLLFYWAGKDEACGHYAAMLEDLVERHGIVTWRPIATFCHGALASRHTDTRPEGIEYLYRAVAQCHEIGHMARLPYYIGVLGEALAKEGRLDEAEARIREALDLAAKQNEQWCMPELLRIQAIALAVRGLPVEQETRLVEAIALARHIGAKSWQMRAANELAELWRSQSRYREAKAMLQPIFDTFAEGFETTDLLKAAVLLDDLEKSSA